MKKKVIIIIFIYCFLFVNLLSKAGDVSSLTVSTIFCLNLIRKDGYSFNELKNNKEALINAYNEVIKKSGCDIIVEPSEKDLKELNSLFSLLNVTEYEFNQMRLIMALIEQETNENKNNKVDTRKTNEIIIDNQYKNTNDNKVFNIGETFYIGKWAFQVIQVFGQESAQYLTIKGKKEGILKFVHVAITNKSKREEYLPFITLVDKDDNEFSMAKEYEISVYHALGKASISSNDRIKPSLTKKGYLVFDVPSNRSFKLKIYDNNTEYNSKEFVFVDLSK